MSFCRSCGHIRWWLAVVSRRPMMNSPAVGARRVRRASRGRDALHRERVGVRVDRDPVSGVERPVRPQRVDVRSDGGVRPRGFGGGEHRCGSAGRSLGCCAGGCDVVRAPRRPAGGRRIRGRAGHSRGGAVRHRVRGCDGRRRQQRPRARDSATDGPIDHQRAARGVECRGDRRGSARSGCASVRGSHRDPSAGHGSPHRRRQSLRALARAPAYGAVARRCGRSLIGVVGSARSSLRRAPSPPSAASSKTSVPPGVGCTWSPKPVPPWPKQRSHSSP